MVNDAHWQRYNDRWELILLRGLVGEGHLSRRRAGEYGRPDDLGVGRQAGTTAVGLETGDQEDRGAHDYQSFTTD